MENSAVISKNTNDILSKKPLRSESFTRTSFMNEKTKELMSRLILEKADSIPADDYWRFSELQELIDASLNMGLIPVADKLTERT